MPFPFLPFGAILAAVVLGSAFALFGGLLKLLDRAAFTVRNSIAPGMVAGFRTWSHPEPRQPAVSSPGASVSVGLRPLEPRFAAETSVVEDLAGSGLPTEPVRRR